MKRSGRPPSPTPTAFSGISNYKSEQYRPIRGGDGVPAMPPIDYRLISKTHFIELSSYLAAYLARSPPNARATARQKLTRLTIQQFHELSTDVYDELVRRKKEKEVPFLPVREEFHPKRNQARQKLATLPTSRFEDLSSDVYFELAQRYPEFKEEERPQIPPSPGSTYDDDFPPSPEYPESPKRTGRGMDSGYGGSSQGRQPSLDRRRPSEDLRRPSDDRRRPSEDFSGGRRSQDTYRNEDAYLASRRRPSQDRIGGMSQTSDSTANAQSSTAKSQVIVPNKSTITEEEIEVPYGRDARDSTATLGLEEPPDTASDYNATSPAFGGLSGLSRRLRDVDDDDDDIRGRNDKRGSSDFYKKSPPLPPPLAISDGRASEEAAKMKEEYELKISQMQKQISGLQREVEASAEVEAKWLTSEDKVRQMETELIKLRQRVEEQTNSMRTLQKELDDLRDSRSRDQDRDRRRAQEDEDKIRSLRNRVADLEAEGPPTGGADPEMVEQLRNDMNGLMSELNDLAGLNDEMQSSREADQAVIRDLETQAKEWKRKYELAKTELRNVKATSQLFLQAPKNDDQLPVSADGGIPDVHITAFLSAIDNLLTAGRSNAPTKVLTPMKSVVNAVSAIVEDVRIYERRPNPDRSEVDLDALLSLCDRAEATLSNLVAATKTHATSSGMSPVSLLDAAASHVSATITEMGRTVCIRKATKQEQDEFANMSTSSGFTKNSYSPSLSSVGEQRELSRARQGSASSIRTDRSRTNGRTASPLGRNFSDRRKISSPSSSGGASSPPAIFDRGSNNAGSDESASTEDAWAELKPYLDAQTESIVFSIQSVLSDVRNPKPSPNLNENLTQIITIVSSIVAVCNDGLPPGSQAQGNEFLRELGIHANNLSEIQAMPELTKDSRRIIANSSFAIANAMKGLMKLN